MATPDIGTTISDGYSRGFDRMGQIFGVLIVPAVIVGGTYAIASAVQSNVLGDTVDDAIESVLSGGSVSGGLSFADRLIIGVMSILASVINVFVTTGATAVVAGAFHRERHGAAFELPGIGGSMSAVLEQIKLLQPRLGLLALLGVAGTAAGILNGVLGALVGLAAGIVLAILSIRWIYAPVVCGSGEATGVEAYDRSEQTVQGSWWGTLGVWIVVMIALVLPAAIVAGILGLILAAILGLLGAFVTYAVLVFAIGAFFSSALESAWAQLESGGTPPPTGGYAPPTATDAPPAAAPPVPPADTPPAPPATPPESNGPFL